LGTLVFFEAGELAVAWLDDGRVVASGKTRLASDEEQAALARAVAALPILSAKPGAAARATREFAWIVDGHPCASCARRTRLEPELARLEEVLRKLVPAADARDAYRVDPDHSFIEVKTGSGGLLSAFGHDHRLMVGKLGRTARRRRARLHEVVVSITVQSASLAVVDDDSAKDRAEIEKEMNDHVLETARFPAIEFTSRSVEIRSRTKDVLEAVVEGDLALHGVVRRIRVPCRIELRDRALRTTGELKLKQTDFGISPTSAVAGTVKVDDVVRISFDVFATS
jgi:polyisoprenoid-binding protein YceI